MNYTREVLNRETGDLEQIDFGNWITLKELGEMHGLGRRQTTEVLRRMDVLQVETHGSARHRLAHWFVERGFGKRQHRRYDKYPFDVVGPEGQEWINELWSIAVAELHEERTEKPVEAARAALEAFAFDRRPMTVYMQVYWLADHFPNLSQQQMALVLSVSQPLVNRSIQSRQHQLTRARQLKKRQPEKVGRMGWSVERNDHPEQMAARGDSLS